MYTVEWEIFIGFQMVDFNYHSAGLIPAYAHTRAHYVLYNRVYFMGLTFLRLGDHP